MKKLTKKLFTTFCVLVLIGICAFSFLVYKLETSIDKVIDKEQHHWLISEINKAELPNNFYNTIEKYYPNHFKNSAWESVFSDLFFSTHNRCRCREVYMPFLYSKRDKNTWIPFNQKAFVIARELERQTSQKQCYAFHLSITKFMNARGVKEASQYYFNKDITQLTEKEILTLHLMASHSLTQYDPTLNPEKLERTLNKMMQ
jgi:hypothetical protein